MTQRAWLTPCKMWETDSMTARAAFTQASVRRAIRAVQAEGLRVMGIRPDGLVIVGDNQTPAILTDSTTTDSKWSDVEA